MIHEQNESAPIKDSDQPGHSPILIRVFAEAQLVTKDQCVLRAKADQSSLFVGFSDPV